MKEENKPKEPEPIVKELLAYYEKFKKNPMTKPPKNLLLAYEKGMLSYDGLLECFESITEQFSNNGVDNARIFFFFWMRISMVSAMVVNGFFGDNVENFELVNRAIRELENQRKTKKKDE